MSTKKIIGISIAVIIAVIVVIPSIGVNLMDKKPQSTSEPQMTYQDRINEKYRTVDDCKDVNEYSLPEIQDRCTYIFQMAPP